MGHAKCRVKGCRAKDIGILEGDDRCPQLQTEMLQDDRETKEYLRQHPNTEKTDSTTKHGEMQKRGSKFNPKTWAYFNKAWAIGKRLGPAQGVPYALILWYVSKIIYIS